jgi:hypothetical protein
MSAKSKAQQRFFGMVRAAQKGEMENPSPEVAQAASSMSKSDVKDFAKTKHKGLPVKKEEKDHEVSMAQSQLDSAEKNIKTLKKKLGKKEKNLPAWMQAKITDTEHNMDAVASYQESETLKTYDQFIAEASAAWTRKAGKSSEGGLNEKGRKSYEKENPGSDLKAPSKKVGNPRRASFCARMKGMKSKLTSKKTASDPDSRINKSLRAWNC